jgi:hypothetical protein
VTAAVPAALERFVADVRGLYGEDLLAVVLYGSAATGEHVPGQSDLNLLVLLRAVTAAHLRRAHAHVGRWRKAGIVAPLFLDPHYIQTSTDVFPLEFLDMQAHHRVLSGSDDVLRAVRVDPTNLRLQCEQEMRGKLLRLRQVYLETAGDARRVTALMADSASSFLVILRAALRLAGRPVPSGREAVLAEAATLGTPTAAMREVLRLKRGEVRLRGEAADALFDRYLAEVQALVEVLDRLRP